MSGINLRWIGCLIWLLLDSLAGLAYSDIEYIVVEGFAVEGARKTKETVILRELPFQVGDTLSLSNLPDKMKEAELNLMNTGLFTNADITFEQWEGTSNRVAFRIEVKEAWYFYPIPILELADRNFNVWWVEQNRDINRLNFGLELASINLTGMRDKAKIKARYGYTRTYSMEYSLPYLNKKQTLGASMGIAYHRNREINYGTEGNKQLFYRDQDKFLYRRLQARAGLSLRPAIYHVHDWQLEYNNNEIDSIVAGELNPDFFLEGRTNQQFLALHYKYTSDKRDVRAFAEKGHVMRIEARKEGFGLSMESHQQLTIWPSFFWYSPLGKSRFSTALGVQGKASIDRSRQPYTSYRALGFGDRVLRGYEYYIADGTDMALLNTSLRFKLLDKKMDLKRAMPLDSYKILPLKLYLSVHNDGGYVYDPFKVSSNALTNQWLWGTSIGLDMVFYYDKVIKLQYSINHLKEKGLFVHVNMNI